MMKLGILLAFLGVLSNVAAEQTCKEFIADTTARTMKAFFECKKTMTFKSDEERISKMNCILACAMKKEKFLTADGFVDEASVLAFVETQIPKSVQDKALSLMLKCQEYGSSLDPDEERCLTYNPLIKCALTVMFKVCN